MKKYTFGILLAAYVTTCVFAQAPSVGVGVAEGVDGLVSVSQGNTLGNLVKDTAIVDGARVVTTSTGAATLVLANGCRIDLVPNQAVTIDSKLDCKAQVASVQSNGVGFAVSSAAIVPGFAAGGLGIVLIAHQRSSGR